jgi:hypothetical protein
MVILFVAVLEVALAKSSITSDAAAASEGNVIDPEDVKAYIL